MADVSINDGLPQLRSENTCLNGWVYVDISGRDRGSYVAEAQKLLSARVSLPPGYSITWSGRFEYLERAAKKPQIAVPFALAIIFVLLYLLGYNFSIASAIGFIALAGVAAEFGVIMLIYVDQAIEKRRVHNRFHSEDD